MTEREQITREMDARACEAAIWIALVEAQRLGWTGIADALAEIHQAAGENRRELEAAMLVVAK